MFAIDRPGFTARLMMALALVSVAVPPAALAQQAGIDPQAGRTAAVTEPVGIDADAEKLLRASTDFLASQQRFSAETHSTVETVTGWGQKLQFDNLVAVSVQRPDKFQARRVGDHSDQAFYYDGKSLTLHDPGQGYYASIAAPGTIEEMLDFARTKLDIVAPSGDLIYKNAYQILTDRVTSGFVVGKSVVEGVRCDHLAFRAPHVDWQIWIQEGPQPLPRKFVITTRDLANAPQFAVVITKWNLAPTFNDGLFTFEPPKDARKVEFVPR